MDLKGTRTEENLRKALTGESLARNKYSFYAMHAKSCGQQDAAELFERLAVNEMMHARAWFELLYGKNNSVKDDLKDAAAGEYGEWKSMYPDFAGIAREEGFEEIAALFERVAKIECDHEMQFMKKYLEISSVKQEAADEKASGQAAGKEPSGQREEVSDMVTVQGYRCQFCGAVYEKYPDVCGVCHAIGSFDACEYRK